ncbi:MAG: hypothetical protein H6838_16335 [Planctomycetes bacterium]|nr:hypothetical protein [Planctomycetota bacterium]
MLVGQFDFTGTRDSVAITDHYDVEIQVPATFPHDLPQAFERGGRIASTFHTNPDDGSMCLGSPLRLAQRVAETPTLTGYADNCLVPYLYAHSYLKLHGTLPWDDLPHGDAGILSDYGKMFRARNADEVIAFLALLSLRRRVANKRPCPCRSGRRLGACHARTISRYRRVWSRRKFRSEHPRMKNAALEHSNPQSRFPPVATS